MEYNEPEFLHRSIAIFKKRWRFFMAILTPIILLPLFQLTDGKEGKAAYVCILMTISWALELLPIAVTSLLPVAFLPFFDILGTDYISPIYFNNTIITFFVSLSMAVAFEHSKLHRRIALRALASIGKRINILMMGFMATTAFLSLWITNTATTVMMVSIAQATINELEIFQMNEGTGVLSEIKDNDSEYSSSAYDDSEDVKVLNLKVQSPARYDSKSPKVGNPEDYYFTDDHKGPNTKKSQDYIPQKKIVQNSKHHVPEYPETEKLDHNSHKSEDEIKITRLRSSLSDLSTMQNGLHSKSPQRRRQSKSVMRSSLKINSIGKGKSVIRGQYIKVRKSKKTKKSTKSRSSVRRRNSLRNSSSLTRKSNKNIDSVKFRNKRNKRKHHSEDAEISKQKDNIHRMKVALFLGIACSANIGGSATLTGTVINIVFIKIFKRHYPESDELTDHAWFLYNVPTMLISLTIAWAYLVAIGTNNKEFIIIDNEEVKRILKLHYSQLGAISFHEVTFSILLITLFLFVFKETDIINTWEILISNKISVQSATPSIAIFILLFLVPARPKKLHRSPAMLNWETLKYNLRWGIILYTGGAIVMAEGAEKSGLSAWVAKKLLVLKDVAEEGIIIVMSLIALLVTAGLSSVATAKIMVIVVIELSVVMKINPLYLLIPVMLCCSYSFVSPAGTPANAIVFQAAGMTLKQMALPGIILSISCYIVQLLMISTLGTTMFRLRSFPDWAKRANFTSI